MLRKEAVNYLTNVVENWTEFCRTHKPFADAIETLLKDYNKPHVRRIKHYFTNNKH